MITRDLAIKRVRADTLGYMQRSFPHCVAPRDVREARDVAFFAMEQALHHKKGSVAILMDDGGVSHYRLEALEDIGGKTRYMPSDYRDSQNFDVRERFITWGRRLIGDDIVPPPRALRLLTPPSE
ncbi:MAG: hypothetical protein GDA54_01435 [Alphaproteobacteria bacterium GM7ARS4]|nr:hypothetical protein [Alphaproteobacteria bacterium GM7ARS4]